MVIYKLNIKLEFDKIPRNVPIVTGLFQQNIGLNGATVAAHQQGIAAGAAHPATSKPPRSPLGLLQLQLRKTPHR